MLKLFYLYFLLPIFCFAITDEDFFKIQTAQRQVNAYTVKSDAVTSDSQDSLKSQETNGDELLYQDFHGNFNKALAHDSNGFPSAEAYKSLVKALMSRDKNLFDEIQIGSGEYRLVNPQASLTYSLAGKDCWASAILPAPSFTSLEASAEMVEVYWTALIRDVPFNKFDTDTTVAVAIEELNTLSGFKGPKINGAVTSQTFLRGDTPGDLIGPYISQFFYLPIPHGSTTIPVKQKVPDWTNLPALPINNFNTTFDDWYTTITGGDTGKTIQYYEEAMEIAPQFIRTPRDLSEYVHQDTPGQAAINALLILNSFGKDALDRNNPYFNNKTQDGFVTFGIGEILYLTMLAVQEGLKAAWFQKWQVHRRLRPEEYGFYVQMQKTQNISLGIPSQLIDSVALETTFDFYNTYFLPLAYPEGSPTHPSYPAGHATFMGAAVTILKAFYNENFLIPDPVQLNSANDSLESYSGTLTVGNELNKLAANISLGRDHAGVHYRSDGIQGLLLGEKVAIEVLKNEAFLINENFVGFSLTKFDGTVVTVGGK